MTLDQILKEGIDEPIVLKILRYGDALGESAKMETVLRLWVYQKILYEKETGNI